MDVEKNSPPYWQNEIYDYDNFVTIPYPSISIEEGEIICDKCAGTGFSNIAVYLYGDDTNQREPEHTKRYARKMPITCDKCNGKGKLNWIEQVFCK